jgi:predicted nucleic acid-binding protein
LVADDGAVVPALWRLEVANSLTLAVRRGRIDAGFRRAALGDLALLNITIDQHTDANAWGETLNVADRYQLTLYDAAYLELAQRRGLPLAILDDELCGRTAPSGSSEIRDANPVSTTAASTSLRVFLAPSAPCAHTVAWSSEARLPSSARSRSRSAAEASGSEDLLGRRPWGAVLREVAKGPSCSRPFGRAVSIELSRIERAFGHGRIHACSGIENRRLGYHLNGGWTPTPRSANPIPIGVRGSTTPVAPPLWISPAA